VVRVNAKNKVLAILERFPEGIGLNELHQQTEDICARDTLRKMLNEFQEDKLIEQEPKEPRRGQKILYKCSQSVSKYREKQKTIQERYTYLYNEFVVNCYFADRGRIFGLKFNPELFHSLYSTQSLVNYYLIPSLDIAKEYEGKTRNDLQKIIIEGFLVLRDLYHRTLMNYPTIRTKMEEYWRQEIEKYQKQIELTIKDSQKKSHISSQLKITHKEKEKILADFLEWIKQKDIGNKDEVERLFRVKLAVLR